MRQRAAKRLSLGWVSRDGWLIILARGLRAFAVGAASVILALYLDRLGLSLSQIGFFLSLGIAGSAAFAFIVALFGDGLGRRRLLVGLSVLMAVAGAGLALTDSLPVLLAIAFFGGVNLGGGGASGPLEPLEQAGLADAVEARRRTALYSLYGFVAFGATAFGGLAGGLPAVYQAVFGLDGLAAFRVVILTVSVFAAAGAALYAFLSSRVEATAARSVWSNPFQLRSRRIIFTLSGLFAVDHFAGTLVVQSLVSYWFFTRFGMSLQAIGLIFFGSNLLAAVSLWVAARLANRIGLINTMVFTHIPSSLLLIMVPFLPSGWLAGVAWVIRGFLGTMDVPTRQSYTMAVVRPDERSAMAGFTTVTRSATGTVGPSVSGVLGSLGLGALPFVACGVLKIGYDLALYGLFRNVRPPEEVQRLD
ncbi:MAG: MFS transporter [Chloroflexi bacterium]|nr:MFS transporter [Chloroflexota bacterium]